MAETRGIETRALDLVERAMAQPPGGREAWIRARRVPAGIRDRAIALLAHSEGAAAMLPTGGAPGRAGEAPIPERIGAYRVTGLIGQGGMGAVYRGERASGDFEHTVAIKVIRPGALSSSLVARFLRERQTLARLAHPNIARLFDGGETQAGEPFIVMEFVEGRPLLDWLAQETPFRPARLTLFLAAASAVAFAHQNLVVHGDVTPSNILVDPQGRPKLIDFGIARPALDDVATGPRGTLSQSMTPGFAAPERLAGAPATTLSDVYALGMVLARLVEGEALDPELAAIIARATAADPAARYPTVDALMSDVSAHERGFPVAAVGRGRGYVFGKFVARHRLGVGLASAAGLLIIVSLAASLVATHREQMARAEAELRFQQTRAIARTLLFDAYDEVSHVSGATGARALLARTGLSYLDALAADPKAPLDVRLEVGRGYTRLAQVTGSGQESQLGKFADSNALLDKAQAVLARAYAQAPDDPAVQRAYANLLVEQSGVNLYNNNRIALARQQAQAAQKVLAPIARTHPEAAKLNAIAIQAEGDSYGWDGQYEPSRVTYLRAEDFIAGLPPALANDLPIRKTRSALARLLAEAQHELGDDKAAAASMDRAVALNEALVAGAPDDPTLIRKLATSLWYRAVILRAIDRDAAAAASIGRAVDLTRGLRARDPKDAGSTHLFSLAGEVQAQVLSDLNRFPESFAVGREVIAAHRQLVAQADDAAGARRSMAASLISVGAAHYNGADYASACAHWSEATGIFADLDRQGVLTGHDRGNTLPEAQTYLTRNCAPPHEGMKRPL